MMKHSIVTDTFNQRDSLSGNPRCSTFISGKSECISPGRTPYYYHSPESVERAGRL